MKISYDNQALLYENQNKLSHLFNTVNFKQRTISFHKEDSKIYVNLTKKTLQGKTSQDLENFLLY